MYSKIREVKEILDRHKIMFWPDCGTLLFMYRDNKLDSHDVDFSMYQKDTKKLMNSLPDFIKMGFHIHGIYDYKNQITEVSFRNQGFAFDVFIRQRKGRYLVGYSKYVEYGTTSWGQPNKFFKFKKFNFDGMEYSIPEDTEEYLSYFFGKDWKIPKPIWNSATDAPCINKVWL